MKNTQTETLAVQPTLTLRSVYEPGQPVAFLKQSLSTETFPFR